MFHSSQSSNDGDLPPFSFSLPTYRQETVRHILLGDYGATLEAINQMLARGYSDRIAWSDPIPSGRSGEYISVMTRKRGVTGA